MAMAGKACATLSAPPTAGRLASAGSRRASPVRGLRGSRLVCGRVDVGLLAAGGVVVIGRPYGEVVPRSPVPRVRSGRRRPARNAKTGSDRAVTYRIYPTARQGQALVELLVAQRDVYNAALEERRGAWRWERRPVTRYEQFGQLSGDRDGFEWLARFGVGGARGTMVRLGEAVKHSFRRVREG